MTDRSIAKTNVSSFRQTQIARKTEYREDLHRLFSDDYINTSPGQVLSESIDAYLQYLDGMMVGGCVGTILLLSAVVGSFYVADAYSQSPFDFYDFSRTHDTDYPSFDPLMNTYTATIAVVVISYLLTISLVRFWSNRGYKLKAVSRTAFLVVCSLITLRFLISSGRLTVPSSLQLRAVYEGCYSGAVWLLGTIVSAYIYGSLFAYIRHVNAVRRPEIFFISHLFRALVVLETIPKLPHRTVVNKQQDSESFVALVERAAEILEVMPSAYALPNSRNSDWIVDAFKRRAAALRALQTWFVLPKNDTRSHLEGRLRQAIDCAARGNWDGLPQDDYKASDIGVWRKAFRIARTLFVAFLPMATLIAAQRSGVLPNTPFEGYISAIVWAWAIVNVLSLLDPRFGEKMSNLKDLSSFTFFGKGKE